MAKLKKILCLLPVLAISLSGMAGCTESEIDESVPPVEGGEGNENEDSSGSLEENPSDNEEDEGSENSPSGDEFVGGYGSDDYIDENGHNTSSDLPADTERHEEHIVYPDLYLHENYDSEDNLVFTHEGEEGDHEAVTLSKFEEEMGEVKIFVSTRRGLEGALELIRCVDYDTVGQFSDYATYMGYTEPAVEPIDDDSGEESSGSWKEHALNYADILEQEGARTTRITIEIDHDLDLTSSYYLEKSESGYGRHYSVGVRSYSLVCDVPYVTIAGADGFTEDTDLDEEISSDDDEGEGDDDDEALDEGLVEDDVESEEEALEYDEEIILKVPSGVLIHADGVRLENFILLGEDIHYWKEERVESVYGPSEIVGVTKGENVVLRDVLFSRHESWDSDHYTYDTFDYSRCVTMFQGATSLTIDRCTAKGYSLDGVVVEMLKNGTDASLTITNSHFDDIIRYPLSVTFNHPWEGTRDTTNGSANSYPDSADPTITVEGSPTTFGNYSFSPYWFYNEETDYGYANSFRLHCEGSSFSGYVRVFNHRACVTDEDDPEPTAATNEIDETEEESTVISGPTKIVPYFYQCSFHFGLLNSKKNTYGLYETDADSHFFYCDFENIGYNVEYGSANDGRWESGAHRYLFAPATLTVHDSRGHIFESHRYSATIALYYPHCYRYAADGETLYTSYYIGENNIYHHITYEWYEELASNEDPDKSCGFYLHKETNNTDENGNRYPGEFDWGNLFFPSEWDEELVEE
ncbi:MAG: hypothetical protein LUB56_01300 [Coprobacillus sp.]|nr:hypothetical protein [Coprobacillus sp.]